MNWSAERVSLPLDRAFTISRGTQTTAENVVVRVEHDGAEGVGAAAPSARYGETPATAEAVLPALFEAVGGLDPGALEAVERRARERVRGNAAARAAVSAACHDLVARRAGEPLYRRLGLDPAADGVPRTSFTVGIDDPAAMREAAAAALDRGHRVLKVKVGTDDDRARLAAVREAAPDATLRIDANEAWRPREAVSRVEALAAFDPEFVEQPVPAGDPADLRFVRERVPVPVAADESCVTAADVPALADAADVVVVKLAKCGGVRAAVRAVHAARAHGIDVMLGCVVASSAAIAPAAHLAPLVEYADLDGALLLADGADPYRGVPMAGGRIDLAAVDAGTGVRPAADGDG